MKKEKWTDERLLWGLLNNKTSKGYWDSLSILYKRPSKRLYDKCITLMQSSNVKERIVGIDVLAQLGSSKRPFLEETLSNYFALLKTEKDKRVVAALLSAVSKNNSAINLSQINLLLKWQYDKSVSVRSALTHALLGVKNKKVIACLILLSKDKIAYIRDWATFGLGSMIATKNEAISEALWERTKDKNDNVRSEAIVGLAQRKDLGIKAVIEKELLKEKFDSLLFRAIALLGDTSFLPHLEVILKESINDATTNQDWIITLTNCIDVLSSNQKTSALLI